jgi:hypothetical protein
MFRVHGSAGEGERAGARSEQQSKRGWAVGRLLEVKEAFVAGVCVCVCVCDESLASVPDIPLQMQTVRPWLGERGSGRGRGGRGEG